MTSEEYDRSVCARLDRAKPVPFRVVSLSNWFPRARECHVNADIWVRANPGLVAVRGWVTESPYRLTAHSVIRERDGNLVDITPLVDETLRAMMRLVEHDGSEVLFAKRKAASVYVDCIEFALSQSQSLLDGIS